jgi:hypothetical protein
MYITDNLRFIQAMTQYSLELLLTFGQPLDL